MQLSGDLVGQLWPALTAGFIFLVGNGWQEAMGGDADAAALSSARFRFRHDRIRQVSAARPTPGARPGEFCKAQMEDSNESLSSLLRKSQSTHAFPTPSEASVW